MPYEPVLSTWRKSAEDIDFQEPDRWYRGEHCHRFPTHRPFCAADILHGWAPPGKLITSDSKVLAFGSCFAEYFIGYLANAGYNRWQLPAEQHASCGEDLLFGLAAAFENIFVILQQFRWAFHEFTPQSKLWFTRDKKYFEASEERREKIRQAFQQVDLFIISLGLSEVWFDNMSNEPMWRSIPARLYEEGRHVCRTASVAETVHALHDFDRLLGDFLPQTRVIFTVSPIPFAATFRNQSPITANQASKAILRAAIDQFMSEDSILSRHCYNYFPSYEMVLHLFDHPFLPDNRHVRPEVAKVILDTFSALYTNLPVSEHRLPERTPDELIEERIRELELQLMEKEQIIQDLAREAGNRLEVIERLSRKTGRGLSWKDHLFSCHPWVTRALQRMRATKKEMPFSTRP